MRGKNNIHHRKPRSLHGRTNKRNCVKVPKTQHEYWHFLFRNYTPEIIAEIINLNWIDPDYELIAIKKQNIQIVENRDIFSDIENN